jgi:uncharacterized protein YgbK (DUF1537 family)
MIAVIADDLSGAAEIANAALQAGFSAEVQLRFCADSPADVICVDTATRSLPPGIAAARVLAVARAIARVAPALVYKKCDSVLRGSVAAESLAVAAAFGKKRVLLIPANPSRQRVIRGGQYYVDGIPLGQTPFASDPEYPRQTSRVAELVGHAPGVETPDVSTTGDLIQHALTVNASTLPAGAVDFFNALLSLKCPERHKARRTDQAWRTEGPSLFVCGSNAAWLAGRSGELRGKGIPVFPMPRALFEKDLREEILARWAAFAAIGLRERGAALLAIGGEEPVPGLTPDLLTERLAQAVELTLQEVPAARVFLEGGATASAIVRQLGLDRFHAQTSPGPGVGALRPVEQEGPIFLIKPGSYSWPEAVWNQPSG